MRVNSYATVAGRYIDSVSVEYDFYRGEDATRFTPAEGAKVEVCCVVEEDADIAELMSQEELEELEERLLQDTLNGEYSD
jgi:hypothetical protein